MGRRLGIAVAVGIVLAAVIWSAARIPLSSDALRSRLVSTLSERLDAEVELGALTLQAFPRLHARGEDLVIRHKGRRDVPPLFSVAAFTVDAELTGLWRRRVKRVALEGLEIHVPPRPENAEPSDDRPRPGPHIRGPEVVVEILEAPGAKLVLLPRNPEKAPKVWNLHELRMESVSTRTTMPFRAVLTNAVPPGFIATDGSFGPWHADDPGHTPLEGRFTFDDADLGVFKGIGGTLSAAGRYQGALERIEVHGTTHTPDFVVRVSGHPVALTATYHAIVDGTNGDTRLERVDAKFLETELTARGGVFDVKGVKGRLVTLDITSESGRLEDFMRLAVPAERPPMTGRLRLATKFELPPGDQDVVEKLRLDGAFVIESGSFTDAGVQRQINALSRRARGLPAAEERRVRSRFAGRFTLGEGTLALGGLTFDVPGAVVALDGRYSLRRETLRFDGDLIMDAKISQTFTGMKSLLLKVVDPLFRRDGRTVVPIRITGTRNAPSFGMDVKRVFRRESARR